MSITTIDEPLDFSIKEKSAYSFTIRGSRDTVIIEMSETDIYDLIEILEGIVEKFHT